jgi:vacuolar protein sorting-associated protein 26
LGGYDLTPTMKDVQRKFSVRYFLNLVLIDEEERRYFKQQVRLNLFDFEMKKKILFFLLI